MSEIKICSGAIDPINTFKEGWAVIRDEYWLMLGITLVGIFLSGATIYVLAGPLLCGIYYAYFAKLANGRADFDDLWKGFRWFWPSFVVIVILVAPFVVIGAGTSVAMIVAVSTTADLSQAQVLSRFGAIVIAELVIVVASVCVQTLFMFSIPLIVDKGLSAGAALSVSARGVMRNLGGITGMFAVGFVLMVLGQLAFCVGTYFVLPLIFAANAVAYRKVFPSNAEFRFGGAGSH